MKKVLNCTLTSDKVKGKDGKVYDNLVICTPKGVAFQVKLSFFNSKLLYKIVKEIEQAE